MTNKQPMAGDRGVAHETICLLGEGGMARVTLAFSRGPADVYKLVVMKQMHSELARDERFVTMFLDEARIATRLNHPNVVHTYGVLEEEGEYTLMMEYLDGQTLFDILQRIDLQCFPLAEHLWILTQVLSALEYAHSLTDYDGTPMGLIHRDVSPVNVFVTYNGVVKLLDFGIAKARGAVSVTEKGDFKGKLNYCAPEQIEPDSPPDARSDLFAVGVMLWEALARRRIVVDGSYLQMAQTRLKGREPKIRNLCPDVPPALAAICDRAMAIKPADRYLTAADFQRDLGRYLDSTGQRVGRTQVAELMRRHFPQEQSDMQRRIEEHLHGIRDESIGSSADKADSYADILPIGMIRAPANRPTPTPAPPPALTERPCNVVEMRTEESTPPPIFRQGQSSLPDLPESLLPAASGPSPQVAPPKRWATRRELAMLGVLAGIAAAAGAWWWIDTQKPLMPNPSVAAQDTTRPALSAVAAPTVTTTPAVEVPTTAKQAVENIHIDITAAPSTARLSLDGKAIEGNRLKAEIPRDEAIHVIRAVAPGYLPSNHAVAFSSDVRLAIRLQGERPRPVKTHARRGKASAAQSQLPAPAEASPPAQPSGAIDENNPYAR